MRLLAKVCGLTCAEDAEEALQAGADLLGFVVHPESPRHCRDVRSAAAVAPERGVLVMVAASAEPILRAADVGGVRRIQAHVPAAHRAEVLGRLIREGYDLLQPWADEPGQVPAGPGPFLWEPSPGQTGCPGGSGQAHPMAYPPPGPFLLAGGLDAASLPTRLAALPPAQLPNLRGVDAASRLEREPGRKDPAKVRAFLAALRAFESTPVPTL